MGFVFLLVLVAFSALAAEPRRVLVVHSFGSAAPPFTTASTAFESALTEQMGERVDLDEVSLDVARYATLDMEEAVVELMRKRQAKWQPDLVVPIGSPAGIFVAQYRDRLFPTTTPIIYTGMDQRRLPPGALQQNATFVGTSYDLPGLVEDILQLAPDTTNVVIIIGATPLEHFWADVLRREYAIFTNRLSFTWFNDLSFDQVLERSAQLPPHSFLLFTLYMRDASGVNHNANEALRRLREAANAPINGLFMEQLGRGIVGGRIYSDELEGREAARIAAQILHGEPVTNFPPKLVHQSGPRYDWRELRRWNISESRLPPGSTVLFQRPTPWRQYKTRIIAIAAVVLVQATIISFLLANLISRRRAERSLIESEARFRAVANAAPVMIWVTGPAHLCTFVNKTWLDFTGRSLEQEMGDGWAEGIHPDDRAVSLKTYEDSFDARRGFTMEYRLRKHTGEYAWVLDTGVPRYAADGSFAGYVGSATDISVLKQAEERWRTVVESAHDAMLVINAEGKITLVNARVEKVFGYQRTELIGQPVEILFPETLRAHHPDVREHYMAKPTERSFRAPGELFGRRKDGRYVPVEIGLSPIRTQEGQFVLASIVDITERLAAEAELRESEKRMNMAADAADLGMWMWEAPEMYIWTSAKWKEIHGYALDEEIRYDALIQRVHPRDRTLVERGIVDAFNEYGSFHVEHRLLLPDGTLRWISSSGRVEENPDTDRLRLLGISIDITERKNVEDAAREVSGRLITAQEDERRRIARDLHDDLNQRLAMLSVQADLLGHMNNTPPAQALISDMASHVQDLSSEVHKLSYQLHPAKLDQLGLVAATRSFCQELAKHYQISVDCVHEDIPRDMDEAMALTLYRIVQEGLQNVVKHSRATRASVELRRHEDRITLAISDNGRGFDMAAIGHQAGIGLVGMRERVRLMSGQITFHSAANQGTRVEVAIPLTIIENVEA